VDDERPPGTVEGPPLRLREQPSPDEVRAALSGDPLEAQMAAMRKMLQPVMDDMAHRLEFEGREAIAAERQAVAWERLAAAQEAWNAQQAQQWEADRKEMAEARTRAEEQQRQFAAGLGVPIIGRGPGH
jgi:hypothetical protein